jgi:hypothetical protein
MFKRSCISEQREQDILGSNLKLQKLPEQNYLSCIRTVSTEHGKMYNHLTEEEKKGNPQQKNKT